MSNLYFIHISCPLLYILIVFKLTGYGVKFLLANYLFGFREARRSFGGIPRAAIHLMFWTRVAFSLVLFLMKTSLRLPRIFLSIYMAHPPHSLYFILADLRERKLVAFDFVNPSFTSVSFSVIIFKAILLQKANLTVSSISFFFFLIFCL